MERFTKKSNSIIKEIEYQLKDEKESLSDNNGVKKIPVIATNKLGKLEDIEEEIGIDFITLFKALKHGIYINDGGIVNEIGNIYNAQVKSIEHRPVWGFSVGDDEMKTFYAFKDRGKTWALDKEEFYENIK